MKLVVLGYVCPVCDEQIEVDPCIKTFQCPKCKELLGLTLVWKKEEHIKRIIRDHDSTDAKQKKRR
jgi:predicted RNA-binding Zn-ribbon protein involved in translation (DUF1610 family)